MKNNSSFPEFYFLREVVLDYLHSKEYEETDVADFLIEDEDSMKSVELGEVAFRRNDNTNIVITVEDLFEEAYERECNFNFKQAKSELFNYYYHDRG